MQTNFRNLFFMLLLRRDGSELALVGVFRGARDGLIFFGAPAQTLVRFETVEPVDAGVEAPEDAGKPCP